LAIQINRADQLFEENKALKETLMLGDSEMKDINYEMQERQKYITQLETQIKNLEAEITRKDVLIKSSKMGHTKNSRSTNIKGGIYERSNKREKNFSNVPLSDEMNPELGQIHGKSSFVFNNPIASN
jgi:hypothetical protein